MLKFYTTEFLQSHVTRGVLVVILLLVTLAHVFAPSYEVTLPPPERTEGHAAVVVLSHCIAAYNPVYTAAKAGIDNAGKNPHPPLIVFENGIQLGPAWHLSPPVRMQGMGAYSLRGGTLYFSSSDNTNPATNGRVYTVQGSLSVRGWVSASGLLALILLCLPFVPRYLPIALHYTRYTYHVMLPPRIRASILHYMRYAFTSQSHPTPPNMLIILNYLALHIAQRLTVSGLLP